MIKAVFFDIGNTLYVDKGAGRIAALRVSEYLSSKGYDYSPEELWEAFTSSREFIRVFGGVDFEPWDLASITLMLSRLGIRDPSLSLEVYRVFVNAIASGLVLDNDAVSVLDYLRSKGLRLGILSNMGSYDIVLSVLRRDKLMEYFDVIVASQMIGWKKPSSSIYEYALKLMGVEASEAVHVGDDPIADVMGAKKAGLKVIHKPRPDTPPSPLADAIAMKLSDIPKIIELL